jgi:hypothetical protein
MKADACNDIGPSNCCAGFIPDRVYHAALLLVQQGRRPSKDQPPEAKRVWQHLVHAERNGDGATTEKGTDPVVAQALWIHRSTPARRLVRGLVLARVPAAEIAGCLGVPTEVIEVYESTFWHVRSQLDARGAVAVIIDSCDADDAEREYLRIAYCHGQEAFLQVLGVRPMDPRTTELIRRRMESRLSVQALIAGRLPVDSERAASRVIRDYLQLRRLELTSKVKEIKARNLLEKLQRERAQGRAQREHLREYLREREQELERYAKTLHEQEKQWAAIVAQVNDILQQKEQPAIVAARLASLGSVKPSDRRDSDAA